MKKYKQYREFLKLGIVKKNSFLVDLDLSPEWMKYKVYRFFKKKVSWYENKEKLVDLNRIDGIYFYNNMDITDIFGDDFEPSRKKIKKYLKKL